MDEGKTDSFLARCGLSTKSGRRAELLLAGVTLLWALLYTGATFLITSELLPSGPIPWLVGAVPTFAAVLVLFQYTRFLREADELQRLIQLQALALGFGGGFFVICSYSTFVHLGAPDVDDAIIVTVMPLLYVAGILIGTRRYR